MSANPHPGSSPPGRPNTVQITPQQPRRPLDPPGGVQTTPVLQQYVDGTKPMINQYIRWARVGGGQHGEVYLGRDTNKQQEVAIKIVKRDNPRSEKWKQLRKQRLPASPHTPVTDKLGTTELKIKKEIAIMKKCRHAHVVRLLEVIDDRLKNKIYMVMEYLGGGEVKWKNTNNEPILNVDQTRRILRDAILGLEYLHFQGIIHRDIKPANLLWTDDRSKIKIADFGVSHFSYAQRMAAAGEIQDEDPHDPILLDESDLSKRAGTPSFLAPEVVYEHTQFPSCSHSSLTLPQRPPITKGIDVWAFGVTMYCLLFGKTPFTADPEAGGNGEFSLYNAICNQPWHPEPLMGLDRLETGSQEPNSEGYVVTHLLEHLLQKDVNRRIELQDVKRHLWFTRDISDADGWVRKTAPSVEPLHASDVEADAAMSNVRFRWNWGGNIARRLSSLFRAGGTGGHVQRRGKDVIGLSSAPQVSIGRRKSATAIMGVASTSVKPPSSSANGFRRDKGKNRVEIHSDRQISHPAKEAIRKSEKPSRSKSIERWPSSKRPPSSSLALEGSAPKARRGSETLLVPRPQYGWISPQSQSQSSSPIEERERPRSRFSVNISSIWHWRPNKYSPQVRSPVEVSPSVTPINANAPPLAIVRSTNYIPEFAGVSEDRVYPSHLGGSTHSSVILTAARRASSWGDNPSDFIEVTSLNSDDHHDLDEQAMIVGAGGVSNELPNATFMLQQSSRVNTSPLVNVTYEDVESVMPMEDAGSSFLDSSTESIHGRGFDYLQDEDFDDSDDDDDDALEIRTSRGPPSSSPPQSRTTR